MKRRTTFRTDQQQEQTAAHQAQPASGHEFATPEELLRFDAAQTVVPTEIAQRLQKSSADLPPPARSWLRRLFGS